MKLDRNKSYALSLSGGGARGAYQIGVYQALLEKDIKISAICGTSIGAINGALFAQEDFEKALSLWESITPEMVFNTQEEASLIDKVRDVSKLKELLQSLVDEDKLRNSEIDYGLVTMNLSKGIKVVKFKEDIEERGGIIEYILASANFPTFYRHEINGEVYIDGGVLDNLPSQILASKGYRDIIEVDVFKFLSGFSKKVRDEDKNIYNISSNHDLHAQILFTSENIKENIKRGYLDCKKYDGDYISKYYYIKKPKDESMLKGLDLQDIKLIKNSSYFKGVSISSRDLKDFLFLITSFNRDLFYNKENILGFEFYLSLLEYTAKFLDIPDLIEYEYEEFVNLIYQKIGVIIKLYKEEKSFLDWDFISYIKEDNNKEEEYLNFKLTLLSSLFSSTNPLSIIDKYFFSSLYKLKLVYIVCILIYEKEKLKANKGL